MPRPINPKSCACGCGGMTRGGNFLQGHDSKVLAAIVKRVGGVLEVKRIIEQSKGIRIKVGK